jgi:hypothetical protein
MVQGRGGLYEGIQGRGGRGWESLLEFYIEKISEPILMRIAYMSRASMRTTSISYENMRWSSMSTSPNLFFLTHTHSQATILPATTLLFLEEGKEDMLTVKLYKIHETCAEGEEVFPDSEVLTVVEADRVNIHTLRHNEFYEIECFSGDKKSFFYLVNVNLPHVVQTGLPCGTPVFYMAYVENSAGVTTEKVVFCK